MPFGDRTGPLGLGPRTGKAAGYCSGFGMPGYANPVPGRGWFGFGHGWGGGRGWSGRGRGWMHRYWATGLSAWAGYDYPYGGWTVPYRTGLTVQEEMDILKDQAVLLKKQLEDVQSRISTLEKNQSEENK
ncbi:MAG: DUF5320 domain-containing protein [Nitrospirota bacterium]